MVSTSSVIAIANTPSVNASTRDLFIAANLARRSRVLGARSALGVIYPLQARAFPQVNVVLRARAVDPSALCVGRHPPDRSTMVPSRPSARQTRQVPDERLMA